MSNNSQGKGDEAMSGEVDYEVMRAVRSIGMTAPKNQFFLQVTEDVGYYWSLVWTHIPVRCNYVPISRLYKDTGFARILFK